MRDYLIVTTDEALRAGIVQTIREADPNGVPTHAHAYDPAGYACNGAAIIDTMLPRLIGDGGREPLQPYGIDLMLGMRSRDLPVLLVLPAKIEGGPVDKNDWIVRIANRVGASTITRPIDHRLLAAAVNVLERKTAFAAVS